jgi:hypothetical protein
MPLDTNVVTIGLTWGCTKCNWTSDADWDRNLRLKDVIDNSLNSHTAASKECRGELVFTSQFIWAGENAEAES